MAYALREYEYLLQTLMGKGYVLGPVRSYFRHVFTIPYVFLRHDVDRLVSRAVDMAEAEAKLDVISTYYFRCTSTGRFPREAIARVQALGHEIGYHYETLARAGGDALHAMELFRRELEALRRFAPVETVAAHGSPLARESNAGFTARFDLGTLGLLGEPSADFDFASVLYVTDTGGTFGSFYNVRDRVQGKQLLTPAKPAALGSALLPGKDPLVLLNCHPERWPRSLPGLLQAKVTDGLVNVLKQIVATVRGTASQDERRHAA